MNITLSEPLKAFIDEQVAAGRCDSANDYVRELVETERDRERLRAMVLDGENSPLTPVDDEMFEELRRIARGQDTATL